jgi:Rod binding domain-containing protein
MDSGKLILTQPIAPPVLLEHLSESRLYKSVTTDPSKIEGVAGGEKEQAAKDFESVLLSKLLDEVKSTIGNWGLEKDAASEQIQGIFWLYLARDIANNGGFGLWRELCRFLSNSKQTSTATEPLDKKV